MNLRFNPKVVLLFASAIVHSAMGDDACVLCDIPKVHMSEDPVKGSYIVVLKSPPAGRRSLSEMKATAEDYARNIGGIDIQKVYDVAIPGFAGRMTEEAVLELAKSDDVDYIEEDGYVQADVTWGLDRVDQRSLPMDGAFNANGNGDGVHAYIIDTGIRTTHTDFGGRAIFGTNEIDGEGDSDCNGHGTHVAGTVGGTEWGVAKKVTLVAVKVLSCSGSGSYSGVIAGVNWVMNDAEGKTGTANMSLGGGKSNSMNLAVKNLHNSGVPTVVAAGNSNTDACNSSPASEPVVITVGSTTNTDGRSSFSNYGTCVDIFAPGSSITAPWFNSDTATRTISGTSMASPHVCGGAALLLQGGTSPSLVAGILDSNATPNVVTNPGSGSPNKFLYVGTSSPTPSPNNPPPTPSPNNPPPTTPAPSTSPNDDYFDDDDDDDDNADDEEDERCDQEDSDTFKFENKRGKVKTQTCGWLDSKKRGQQKKKCLDVSVPGEGAQDVCTLTCEQYVKFPFVNRKGATKNKWCWWLARKSNTEAICESNSDAKEICFNTCGACS
jgi:subtilisin family serine protease